MSVGSELLNAPFPQMIENLGKGVAEAQYALDQVSIKILKLMAGYGEEVDAGSGEVVMTPGLNFVQLKEGGTQYSLLALGFTPTFYQFVDTVIELKMAVSMNRSTELGVKVRYGSAGLGVGRVSVASVNASYSQKYQYSVEGSSLIRTKLVTVPAPALLEEIVRDQLDLDPIEPPST